MKLKKIRIQNYKSITDQTIEDFSQVNMIFGHNNSGKSNFLKFIELLFSSKIDPSGDITSFDSSRFDEKQISVPSKQLSGFWMGIIENQTFLFKNNEWNTPINFEVDVEINGTMISGTLTPEIFGFFKAAFFPDANEFIMTIRGNIKGIDDFTSEIFTDSVVINGIEIYNLEAKSYFPTIATLTASGYDTIRSILNSLNNSVVFLDNNRYFSSEKEDGNIKDLEPSNFKNWMHNYSMDSYRYEDYRKLVSQIGEFKPSGDDHFKKNEVNSPISDMKFEFGRDRNELKVLLTNGAKKRFPMENFGTGIQQIIFILAKIAEKKPKILLVEELELNLSPKYQLELVQHVLLNLIEKPDISLNQIFFTTHSPILCCRTNFVMYRVSISNVGESTIKKLGDEKEDIISFYPKELRQVLIEQVLPAPKAQAVAANSNNI